MKQYWHKKVPLVLNLILETVLNNNEVLSKVNRQMSLNQTIYNLGKIKYNCLVVGRDSSWLVNCKTGHKNHYIGTKRTV